MVPSPVSVPPCLALVLHTQRKGTHFDVSLRTWVRCVCCVSTMRAQDAAGRWAVWVCCRLRAVLWARGRGLLPGGVVTRRVVSRGRGKPHLLRALLLPIFVCPRTVHLRTHAGQEEMAQGHKGGGVAIMGLPVHTCCDEGHLRLAWAASVHSQDLREKFVVVGTSRCKGPEVQTRLVVGVGDGLGGCSVGGSQRASGQRQG